MIASITPSGNGAISTSGDVQVVSVDSLWKVFGPHPELAMSPENAHKTKEELLNELGLVVALKGVSFQVQKGETFVVMGLSGSGKSTLIRCLIRLIEPTDGSLAIEGEDILQYDERQLREFRRRRVAMVFQR